LTKTLKKRKNMNTHADKKQKNQSQSVANEVSQKQRNGESTFQFEDNRSEAVAQRKLQEMANNSSQTKQAAQLQSLANSRTTSNINSKVVQPMFAVAGRRAAGAIGGLAYGSFVGKNLYDQYSAHQDPGNIRKGSRLDAIQHTNHFTKDTVGYGVNPSIRAIHALMGGFGESNIGDLFASNEAQKAMAEKRSPESHEKMAKMEYELWNKRRDGEGQDGESTIGEKLGGHLGSLFNPEKRSEIQEMMAQIREKT
jgi:hypothetical protein